MERLVLLSPGNVIDRSALEKALPARKRQTTVTNTAAQDPWQLVQELRQSGLGARKIAKILAQQGHEIKYYQIAYRLDKGSSR